MILNDKVPCRTTKRSLNSIYCEMRKLGEFLMSDPFDSREKGYEAKFKHNEELTFKIDARRNKLLGLWLAEKFGIDGPHAESYAKEVIMADMDEPGIEDVVRKVMVDIKARDIKISENELRQKIEELDVVAASQIK